MGVLIKIAGATFKKEHIIGTVEIPEVECEHAYDHECDTTCNLCGAVRTVPHNLVHVDAVAPTDTENGNVEYWHCTLCDGYWLDEACTQSTTADDVVVLSIGSYPVTDTLFGLYDLGGTVDATLVNHAPEPHVNTQDESIVGTYTVADGYIHFTGALATTRIHTYIPSDLANQVTLVALFALPNIGDGGHRAIISNRRAGTGTSTGLTLLNNGVQFDEGGTVITKPVAYESSENFVVRAVTATPNGVRVVTYTDNGFETLLEYEGSITEWSTNVWQIGGNGTGNIGEDANIALAAMHEGDMTDEQLESICAFVKAYGEQKGLTVE